MIYVSSKRKKNETILKAFPNALIIDVTSKSSDKWIAFSPFYPHGNIPIPFSNGEISNSVEGIWQGLKVFQNMDIDVSKFRIFSMKNLKRTTKKYGKILGHRKGIYGKEILNYHDARFQIYIPSYKWILENKLSDLVAELYRLSKKNDIVLLDYNINENIEDLSKPISHAELIKMFIENKL